MVAPAAGAVVLVPFPFSDLSRSKLRPAVVLADAGRGDWVLCQVTSNPYADPRTIRLSSEDFQTGSLRRDSYARPGKLFTANHGLIVRQVGDLSDEALQRIVGVVVRLLQSNPNKVAVCSKCSCGVAVPYGSYIQSTISERSHSRVKSCASPGQ